MTLDDVFQEKLDSWNTGHPLHPPVHVRWEPKAIKRPIVVWSYGVPIHKWAYEPRWIVGVLLNNRPEGMEKLAQYIEGSGGTWFIKLFTWQTQDKGDFLPIDDRIFKVLDAGDMTKHSYEEMIVDPENQTEAEAMGEFRDLVGEGSKHYLDHDRLLVPVGSTDTKTRRDWRHRTR